MANDLNELTSILFDTLRGVKNGDLDTKQANAVIGISNSIINNAKVQIQAMKYTGRKANSNFLSLEDPVSKITGDRHTDMTTFAHERGYHSVAEAIVEEGKDEFNFLFEEWLSSFKKS